MRCRTIVLSGAHPGRQGALSQDHAELKTEVESHFLEKWGCQRLQVRLDILDAALASEGHAIDIADDDVLTAGRSIKRKSKLDHYGVSVSVIVLVANALPSLIPNFLMNPISSIAIMSSIPSCLFHLSSRCSTYCRLYLWTNRSNLCDLSYQKPS